MITNITKLRLSIIILTVSALNDNWLLCSVIRHYHDHILKGWQTGNAKTET